MSSTQYFKLQLVHFQNLPLTLVILVAVFSGICNCEASKQSKRGAIKEDEKLKIDLDRFTQYHEEYKVWDKAYYGSKSKSEADHQRSEDLIKNPDKVYESYAKDAKENYAEGLKKLEKRFGITEDDLNGPVHSVSESLEFILDYYKKGFDVEAKMDNLLDIVELREKEQSFVDKIEGLENETDNLIKRVENIMSASEIGSINRREYSTHLIKLVNDEKEVRQRLVAMMRAKQEDIKSLETKEAIITKEYERFNEEDRNWRSMFKLFTRHRMGLTSHVPLADKADLPLTEGGLKNRIDLDLKIFEQLLKKYQRLEGLKNQLLVAKKEEEDIEQEIENIEVTDIPEFIVKHAKELRQFSLATTQIAWRNMKKLINVDMLFQDVAALKLSLGKLTDEVFNKSRKLGDLLEEAASVKIYLKLKDEL